MTAQDISGAQAQVTHKVERTHGGMPNWAFLGIGRDAAGKMRLYWPYRSRIDDQPFLTRFIVIRNPWFSMDVTRVSMADDDREWPHDHSRTFRSLKLGWYSEWVYRDKDDLTQREHRRHRRFSLHTLRYTEAHSITEVSPHLVTILFLGRQRQKSNYWTPAGLQTIGMAVDQEDPGQEVWA
jgi:hypothetical protein